MVKETGRSTGELVAAGSAMVAVAWYIPALNPAGFATNKTPDVALAVRVPEIGLKVSHDAVDVAVQLSVVDAGPPFPTTTVWVLVATAP